MTALSNVEAKKRFEFLEAVSGTMDAHLRYFKQVCHMSGLLYSLYIFYRRCTYTESFHMYSRVMSYCIRWSHTLIRFANIFFLRRKVDVYLFSYLGTTQLVLFF